MQNTNERRLSFTFVFFPELEHPILKTIQVHYLNIHPQRLYDVLR
jgi:hypothetical protein